jgi:hypothetical protein
VKDKEWFTLPLCTRFFEDPTVLGRSETCDVCSQKAFQERYGPKIGRRTKSFKNILPKIGRRAKSSKKISPKITRRKWPKNRTSFSKLIQLCAICNKTAECLSMNMIGPLNLGGDLSLALPGCNTTGSPSPARRQQVGSYHKP